MISSDQGSWPPQRGAEAPLGLPCSEAKGALLEPHERWPPCIAALAPVVLDHPSPMALFWGSGPASLCNAAFERVLGKALLLGPETASKAPPPSLAGAVQGVLGGSGPLSLEHVPLQAAADGERRFAALSLSAVRDETGCVAGVLVTARDTSARAASDPERGRVATPRPPPPAAAASTRTDAAHEALRASERRLRALVTASADVVYRMSADFREVRQLEGRKRAADAPTTTWLERYIPPDDRETVLEAQRAALRDGCMFELEHRVLRDDGSLGWVHSRAIPVLNDEGQIEEWFGVAVDVSERKRAEDELREADRRKDEFLAVLGHELRNPLAAIQSASELMKVVAPTEPRLRRISGVLERQSAQMARLIDGLFDVLRIARGKVQLEPEVLDARALLEGAGWGAGAELRVRLPLAAARPPAHPDRARRPPPSPRRLLIVEDDVDAGEALRALLAARGHDVTLVEDGSEALALLRRTEIDVVLCDLGLPGMSGYEVARAIRSDPALCETRLVAVTSYGQPDDHRRASEAGFDAHLVKPLELEALEALLSRVADATRH